MSNIEIEKFAKQIGLTEKQLIDQLKNIGINVNKSKQIITEGQKKDLLNYLENKYSKKEKVIKNLVGIAVLLNVFNRVTYFYASQHWVTCHNITLVMGPSSL